MSLDKLIKKPKFVETIPQVINQEIQSEEVSSNKFIINKPEENVSDFIEEVKEEINNLQTFVSSISFSSTDVPINGELAKNLGTNILSYSGLINLLDSNSSYYPQAISSWENYHYKNTLDPFTILAGSMNETIKDLRRSLDYASSNIQIPEDIIKAERKKIQKTSIYRSKLQALDDNTKKKLEECLINKTVKTLVFGSSKESNLNKSREDVIKTLRAIVKLLKYSIILSSVDFKNIRSTLNNRFLNHVVQTYFQEITTIIFNIENTISAPIIKFIEDFQELSDQEFCGAFDEAIFLVINEMTKLRQKHVQLIYEYENSILKKFEYRDQQLELVSKKTTTQRTISLIILILEKIDQILSSGELSQDLYQWIRDRMSPAKPNKPVGPGDFPIKYIV